MIDTRRIRFADLLAALGGVLLLVSPLLRWYGGRDGWSSSPIVAGCLSIVGLVAIALFLAILTQSSPALPVALGVWLVPLGLAASLIAAVRLLSPPDGAGRCYGAWVALGASVLTLVGAWRSIGDERPRRGAPPSIAAPPS